MNQINLEDIILATPFIVSIGAIIHLCFTPEEASSTKKASEYTFNAKGQELARKIQFQKTPLSYEGFFVFNRPYLSGVICNSAYACPYNIPFSVSILKELKLDDQQLLNEFNTRVTLTKNKITDGDKRDSLNNLIKISDPTFISSGYKLHNISKKVWQEFWDNLFQSINNGDMHIKCGHLFIAADNNTCFFIRSGSWGIGFTQQKKVVIFIESHNTMRCNKKIDYAEITKEYSSYLSKKS